jgi:hypothetical protein
MGRTFAFLKHAVGLHLHGQTIADLIHEERAAMSRLEGSSRLALAPVNAPSYSRRVRFRRVSGAAVDGDEGSLRATFSEWRAFHQFFQLPLSPVMRTRLDCGAMVWIKSKMAHLGTLPDTVQTGRAAQLAEVPGLFSTWALATSFCATGQPGVVLNNVAIGAGVDGAMAVDGGYAGYKQEKGVGEISLNFRDRHQ